MMNDMETVRRDFDKIAALEDVRWDHNAHYHPYLLRNVPDRSSAVLEVGCGKGDFAKLLEAKSRQVIAVDLSQAMVRKAMDKYGSSRTIHFVAADIMDLPLEQNTLDCIVSIAVLHHLDMNEILPRLKRALKPGGVLIIMDLYKQEKLSEYAMNVVAAPLHWIYSLSRNGKLRPSKESLEAWNEHGGRDEYMTTTQLKEIYAKHFKGFQFRTHLFWRYSMIWEKWN